MTTNELLLYSAFTNTPTGGNPAGVWLGTEFPSDRAMLRIAGDVGFSETVFAVPNGDKSLDIRYFSPKAEVSFCGHATIALGARLAHEQGPATYLLNTQAGEVRLEVESDGGAAQARLTSVEPSSDPADPSLVSTVLQLLDWSPDELDPNLNPAITFGGAYHLLLAVSARDRLSRVEYDFDKMLAVMTESNLTTVNLVWKENEATYVSRNLFPVGGVVEDPATGAAAAALGGHLRTLEPAIAPTTVCINQGDDMGRPSRLKIHIPATGGIEVSGEAVPITLSSID